MTFWRNNGGGIIRETGGMGIVRCDTCPCDDPPPEPSQCGCTVAQPLRFQVTLPNDTGAKRFIQETSGDIDDWCKNNGGDISNAWRNYSGDCESFLGLVYNTPYLEDVGTTQCWARNVAPFCGYEDSDVGGGNAGWVMIYYVFTFVISKFTPLSDYNWQVEMQTWNAVVEGSPPSPWAPSDWMTWDQWVAYRGGVPTLATDNTLNNRAAWGADKGTSTYDCTLPQQTNLAWLNHLGGLLEGPCDMNTSSSSGTDKPSDAVVEII